MKKKSRAELIAATPISKIAGSTKKELITDIRNMRRGYRRRASSIEKSGKYSYALDEFKESKASYSDKPYDELSRNQLLHEFFRYARFFNSESSTLAGINRINREQDARIFGTKGKSKTPVKNMTEDERKQYWSLYDEFRNQHPELAGKSYSEFAQQTLGEASFTEDSVEENLSAFLEDVATKLRQRIRSQEPPEVRLPNVYMGRRNDIE